METKENGMYELCAQGFLEPSTTRNFGKGFFFFFFFFFLFFF